MGNPVKNHVHMCGCVYLAKDTLVSTTTKSIKCSSTDMSKKVLCRRSVYRLGFRWVCVDQCLVGGFLFPTTDHQVKKSQQTTGRSSLCQVTEMYFDKSEKPPYYKSCYKHMEELFGCAITTIVSNQVPQPS